MTTGFESTAFDTSLFIPELRYRTLEPVLGEMAARALRAGAATDARHLRGVLAWREKAGSTRLGREAAIPHVRSISVTEPCLVVARSQQGVVWDETSGERVRLVLMALSPSTATLDHHLDWVARIAAMTRVQRSRQRLLAADTFEEMADLLREACA